NVKPLKGYQQGHKGYSAINPPCHAAGQVLNNEDACQAKHRRHSEVGDRREIKYRHGLVTDGYSHKGNYTAYHLLPAGFGDAVPEKEPSLVQEKGSRSVDDHQYRRRGKEISAVIVKD